MQKNETIITPLYRAIITILERNGLGKVDLTVEEIKRLYEHWNKKLEKDFEGKSGKEALWRTKPVQCSIKLLEKYKEQGTGRALEYWTTLKETLDSVSEECDSCYICKNCTSYFWDELGEVLFDVENRKKANGIYFPLRRLPQDISKYLEPSVSLEDIYRRRGRGTDNRLIMLKGMSSSTPAMLNSTFDTDKFAGGGWYFRYNGYGVAIDPGYHFLENLHHYGMTVLDINAVVVTHEHIDHNSDMRIMDDLMKDWSGNSNRVTWYLDEVSYQIAEIYRKNETGFDKAYCDIKCVSPGDKTVQISESIEFETFPTQHIFRNKEEKKKEVRLHTFGCKFKLSDGKSECCLAYTSDTRFYKELTNYVKDADILIANISGVYEDDYMMVKAKERHLGYYGCRKLLEACVPGRLRYFILSEFWNGTGDIRFSVPRNLQNIVENITSSKTEERDKERKNVKVIPGEIGIEIDLDTMKIKCDKCGFFAERFIITKPVKLYEKVAIVCGNCFY